MLRSVVIISALACAYASASPRIIGGEVAKDSAYPFQISLRINNYHSCSGTIINPTTILTAAHCVQTVSISDLTVVAGSNTLSKGGDSYSVSKVHVHPAWDPLEIVNDIAIVKLADSIKLGPKVQRIELEEKIVPGGEVCTVSGWGSISYPEGEVPNELQNIDLRTISVEECREAHGGAMNVYASEICTLTKAGEGVCFGDSGGPLIRNGKQIGIVSWVRPCAVGYPDVYTRVTYFKNWIKKYL